MRRWLKQRMDERYVDRLIQSHFDDNMEDVVDRRVQDTLLRVRMRFAIQPWLLLGRSFLAMVRVLGSYAHGRYRAARQKIYGGSTQTANSSAGAGSIAAQIASTYTSGFAAAGGTAPAPVAPQTFEDAGIRAGEVVAYRCWVLREDGLLHSAYQSEFVWMPGEIVEGNPTRIFEGIHAFKDRKSAVDYIAMYEENSAHQIVSGTVELWGDVYEHQRGYRASKAAIASIDDSPNYDAAALRKLYKIGRKKRKK